MIANEIPNAFVWTKIQAEAGQAIDRILNRKELERQAVGTFWWGVGESKANSIAALVETNSNPIILFSQMRSRPHRRDSDPDGVLLWEAYKTSTGTMRLPPHVIVTSRANDKKGRPKLRHYALVCTSEKKIRVSGDAMVDTGKLRNFGDGGKALGSSQITAVVERSTRRSDGLCYPITATAMLIVPYAVQLTKNRRLSSGELRRLHEVSCDGKTVADWISAAEQLRQSD